MWETIRMILAIVAILVYFAFMLPGFVAGLLWRMNVEIGWGRGKKAPDCLMKCLGEVLLPGDK